MVLGKDLTDDDFVCSDADPWAIARSNIARRHLTDDQKAMLALDDLVKERAKAAERKRAGGEKGRKSNLRSHGKGSVPSEKAPQKRAKRASEIVAGATGVSLEKLRLAENVVKADPKLRAPVANGTMTLPEAATVCNISLPKRERGPRKSAAAHNHRS